MFYENYNNMKTTKLSALLYIVILCFISVSCDDSIEDTKSSEKILPGKFTVDIPKSISNNPSNGRIADSHGLGGNEIYEAMGLFINIGEESAKIIEAIIGGIAGLGIDRALILTYQSDDDGRTKNLEVVENPTFEGTQYEFEMTITDADSEGNDDGGIAMQIFWNRNPVKGVALLKPFNIDRAKEVDAGDAIFRIDYDESGEEGYDAFMIVSLANLPLPNPKDDPFAIDNLKMFVGRKGDNVDVYGNSNHPNATLFTDDAGLNWAFVASGAESADIGVAEVGLPPSNLDETSRSVILGDYSIKQVFTDQIFEIFPEITQTLIDEYLVDTDPPGFFDSNGFVQGGTSPGAEYDVLVDRIQNLTPYNPNDISNLEIDFN